MKINFKLTRILRKRVLLAVKKFKKSRKTLELVGCDVAFLRAYLESMFKDGMSWKNHTLKGWHIDHIKPCSSFDLSDPEQQKLCFHYTNLQPLWWWENLSKGNSLIIEET